MNVNTYHTVSTILWAISTLLWIGTLATGIATACIYYRQLRTMRKQLRDHSLPVLIQYLESPAVREARRIVTWNLKSKPYDDGKGWTDDEKEAAAAACAAFNVAGSLAELDKIDPSFILDHWGDSAIRVRRICADFIDARIRSEGKRYFKGLLYLAELAERTS